MSRIFSITRTPPQIQINTRSVSEQPELSHWYLNAKHHIVIHELIPWMKRNDFIDCVPSLMPSIPLFHRGEENETGNGNRSISLRILGSDGKRPP